MESSVSLLERLRDRQGATTDEAFAQELTIGRSTWTLIRLRKRNMGAQTIRKVLARYPSLRDEAMDYLASLPAHKHPSRGRIRERKRTSLR